MRIALFADTYYPQINGVALTLQRLVHHMERRGIEHQLFVPETSEDVVSKENIYRMLSVPFLFYPEHRIALPNVFKVRKKLDAFAPDLIHVATPFNIGLCGMFYGKKHHIPLVASYHTHFDRYLEHYHLQLAAPIFWRYFRWFHQHCIRTFVPSYETLSLLSSQGIQGLQLWSRGVDSELFSPERRNDRIRSQYGITAPNLLLYVGRLAPEKDIDVLVDIMRGLPPAIAERTHWLIVGEGPLLTELRDAGLPRVTFTGCLQGEQLAEAYAAADLFVFPSSSETFGNVALEALASGLPVVGARAGGVQEIIAHGHNGMLCKSGDAEHFIRTIAELVDSQETLRRMGEHGRRYALTQSWDGKLDGLLEHYRGSLEVHRTYSESAGTA